MGREMPPNCPFPWGIHPSPIHGSLSPHKSIPLNSTMRCPQIALPLGDPHFLPPHTHTFNGPLSGTTQVSRYQKGKTNLDFNDFTLPNTWLFGPTEVHTLNGTVRCPKTALPLGDQPLPNTRYFQTTRVHTLIGTLTGHRPHIAACLSL